MAWPLHYGLGVRRTGGFTLIEVMIVVAIVGILAAILILNFTGQPKRVKSRSEVNAMFGELHRVEGEYILERGAYYATGVDDGDIFPASPAQTAQTVGTLPDEWIELKVQVHSEKLYCGYVVAAGVGADPIPSFAEDFGMEQPSGSWYALYAECNQDGNSSVNGKFFSSSVDMTIQRQDETK